MPIRYYLLPNALTDDPNDFIARVQRRGTKTLDDIVEAILESGSTVTRPDVLSVLDHYHTLIERFLAEGYFVTTPTAIYRLTMRGRFESVRDTFDARRHKIHIAVHVNRRLERAVRLRAEVHKIPATAKAPVLAEFFDLNSGERNARLTPGGIGRLIGYRLHFDQDDPQQGIYFTAEEGQSWRASIVARNTYSELIFSIPDDLPPGTYRLEVRAILWLGSDIRHGELPAPLIVHA